MISSRLLGVSKCLKRCFRSLKCTRPISNTSSNAQNLLEPHNTLSLAQVTSQLLFRNVSAKYLHLPIVSSLRIKFEVSTFFRAFFSLHKFWCCSNNDNFNDLHRKLFFQGDLMENLEYEVHLISCSYVCVLGQNDTENY